MSEPNGVAMPQTTPQYQFNGINSNNTSRGSSPLPRASQIPSSQLPPMKSGIPASQLPPTRSAVSGLVRNVSQLSVSSQNTPNVSPSKFSTSTPNEEKLRMSELSDNASSLVPKPDTVPVLQNIHSDALIKNTALPKASNINSLPSNRISDTPRTEPPSQLNISTPSKYFNENGSNYTNVINDSDRSNFRTVTPQSFMVMQNSQVEKKSGEHFDKFLQGHISENINHSQKSTNRALCHPTQITSTFSQSNINTNSFIRSTPQNANSQQASTSQFQSSSVAQGNIVPQGPNQHILSGVSTLNKINSTYPVQYNVSQSSPQPTLPLQNINSKPPVQLTQNMIGKPSKPRYPQTLPSNLMQPQIPDSSLPPNAQCNAGLYNPNSLSQSQAEASPSFASPQVSFSSNSMPPNQSFYKPQIGLNGPVSLPSSIPTKPGISANRYPAQAQTPLQNQQGQYPQQQQLQYPQQQQQQLHYPQQQHMQYAQQQQKTQYPQQKQLQYPLQQKQMQYPQQQYGQTAPVVQSGFNRLWGTESHDLLQLPNILPSRKVQPPQINLGQDALNKANCSPDVFRCTMTKIPETASLLQKARLPLGMLIHPFKDLNYLPVIQCNVIVRCRACRTYINPFVSFVDSKRWKCNLCYRINELPEEFQYDPVSKTYGDPSRRPEIKSSTIEYIAPAEYMLRPPQPAVYLFLIDVSRLAIESGYLEILCNILLEELKNLPGDARTQIGFLAYDSAVHFLSLAEGLHQPHEMTVLDIEDVFLPTPDNLLVNLKDRMELVEDLLKLLPLRFGNTFDGNSALGAALQVAHKMMSPTGGRVTVFQASLPNIGPGAVTSREDPNQRSSAEVTHLNPANDFYKKLALDCSAQQIAVDLFIVNSQYVDIATISGISRFSGGCINHFPLFKSSRPLLVDGFQKCLRRYLTRKIGFEAVMRVRCTKGLSIHTFHGNFFVRSTDLLSLPNVSPDAAFGMQVAIEESLSDCQTVCFQAALLYTSSKGERRIRVHTLCIPVASNLHDIIHSADQQCAVGLLAKMAVDRSMQSSLSDAREAFINAAIDCLSAYKFSLNMGSGSSGLLVPECLKLLCLYISAILKHPAFRIGSSTRLDDRVKAMIDLKTKPLPLLLQSIYPDMYPIHNLESQEVIINEEEEPVPLPPRLQLTARCLENKGAFLMDCGDQMLILVGPNVSKEFLNEALGVTDYGSITDSFCEIPLLDDPSNARLHHFINYLNDEKPYPAPLHVIRDNSPNRTVFLEKLIEDRLENSLSYHEFLQHLKTQVK